MCKIWRARYDVPMYDTFHERVSGHPRPVILIEGTRELPADDRPRLTAFARWLALTYPHAVFRTGNAKGADEAFAEGVESVDPARLEYVLPYAGHRKKSDPSPARRVALDAMPPMAEKNAAYTTEQASPEYASLLAKRDRVPRLRAKAGYLLRDTIKVSGADEADLNKAVFGIFYVNPDDPMKGGTGHTIRVCRTLNVPTAFQDEWLKWPQEEKRVNHRGHGGTRREDG